MSTPLLPFSLPAVLVLVLCSADRLTHSPGGSLVSIICVSGGTLLAVEECFGIIHQSLKRARDIMDVALGRPTFHVRVGALSFAAQGARARGGVHAHVCVCGRVWRYIGKWFGVRACVRRVSCSNI